MRLYDSDREEYLGGLGQDEMLAYERVRLFLATVGKHMRAKGDCPPMYTRDMHKLFPVFAKEMGYQGKLYHSSNDVCPAISVLFPESDDAFWMMVPITWYSRLTARSQKLVDDSQPALDAALIVCKTWLPNWNW